ncbi:MAG TPA: ribonuclease R, partial [Xanthomonadaceae bacterium]|nr:ribonuclease R [Xanthomonadaceae bacterium]
MARTPSKRGGSRQSAASRGTKSPVSRAPRQGEKRPPWMPEPAADAPRRRGRGRRDAGQPDTPPASAFRDPNAHREAQRYAEPIASRVAILQVLAAADGPMDADA